MLCALAAWPGRAAAHDTIVLTVSGDASGAVTVVATWRDGHQVTEPVAATLSATSDTGQAFGPVKLLPVADSPGMLRMDGRLPAGTWTVVVESGAPAIGRGQATVRVGAAASAVPPAPVPASASAQAAPPLEDPPEDSGVPIVGIVVVLVAGVGAALLWRFARR